MATSISDLKKLWGLAAGRCSKPGCNTDCIKFFNENDPTILGEMAHVIAQKQDGPRGIPGGGSDSYDNLILLCPTHHKEIDRAPVGTFSVETILGWKRDHEGRIRSSIDFNKYKNISEAATEIRKLLSENYNIWHEYGPSSEVARTNPLSNASEVWNMRKLSEIVPNNTAICQLIDRFSSQLDRDQLAAASLFKDHAKAFEAHCYSPKDSYRTFPSEFSKMVELL